MSMLNAGPQQVLLVEGDDDDSVIWHLNDKSGQPQSFEIVNKRSVEQVLGSVATEAVAPGRTALGIVVDANSNIAGRWQRIGDQLGDAKIRLPRQPDPLGTVVPPSQPGKPKIGVWLMPDNVNPGELENFVSDLIPAGDGVWPQAQNYVAQVPAADRPSKPAKAEVHAWLAVRAEGDRMGTSIGAGTFDLQRPAAQAFLDWLRRVFG
ncbi:DUF3226 domain-containing protein [Candidatus Poriferisodalis sp.]|uniref:DUF3226 domain-containing protein n=1 Tax=Candidatus Poriferisodalis sp. TaxID=3101277 RepID=UPI003AF4692E